MGFRSWRARRARSHTSSAALSTFVDLPLGRIHFPSWSLTLAHAWCILPSFPYQYKNYSTSAFWIMPTDWVAFPNCCMPWSEKAPEILCSYSRCCCLCVPPSLTWPSQRFSVASCEDAQPGAESGVPQQGWSKVRPRRPTWPTFRVCSCAQW